MATGERAKMLAGQPFDTRDPELMAAHRRARALLARYNAPLSGAQADDEAATPAEILRALLGQVGDGVWIEPPFFCDYGAQIEIGDAAFLNFNCVLLDAAPITIGAQTLIGPAAQIYTAAHPLEARDRVRPPGVDGPPYSTLARPVSIGARCWIGGGAILSPGVSIGDGSVIGAGAVVTRSVPPNVFAAGNPARVVRTLDA